MLLRRNRTNRPTPLNLSALEHVSTLFPPSPKSIDFSCFRGSIHTQLKLFARDCQSLIPISLSISNFSSLRSPHSARRSNQLDQLTSITSLSSVLLAVHPESLHSIVRSIFIDMAQGLLKKAPAKPSSSKRYVPLHRIHSLILPTKNKELIIFIVYTE
jgi:hypothetical protein